MKRFSGIILALGAFLAIFALYLQRVTSGPALNDNSIRAILIFNPSLIKDGGFVLDAWKSVLEEEGIPYSPLSITDLLSLDPKKIARLNPAIFFPDHVNQILPYDSVYWIDEYLKAGGNVFIAYDAGVKNTKNAYLRESIFTKIIGLNYITYENLKEKAYTAGYFHVKDKNFLEIPLGKLTKDNLLCGYKYKLLQYPMARVELKNNNNTTILATLHSESGDEQPGVLLISCGKGRCFYVNMPIGYLKAYSDDLLLRCMIRAFLFKVVRMPHLQNTPFGKGGLVIDWHIDANLDWKSIPFMLKNRYLRKGINYSIDITAGDFRDRPGDGLGFDACGKGGVFVKELMAYGTIGSHGGWGHNWFAENLENNHFNEKDIYKYIKKNNDCLQSITQYPILEYAAPAGVNPQPVTTKVLEKLGVIAYYYTGDSGSQPNRTFWNGKMVSKDVIAFPIMPYQGDASLYEMAETGRAEGDVRNFFKDLADYCVRHRTIRLFYSHPYNIDDYPQAVLWFIDYVEYLSNDGKLLTDSMANFSKFIKRFLKTKYSFKIKNKNLTVELKNPEGLEGITLAIPKANYARPNDSDMLLDEDIDYYYLAIRRNINEKVIIFNSM